MRPTPAKSRLLWVSMQILQRQNLLRSSHAPAIGLGRKVAVMWLRWWWSGGVFADAHVGEATKSTSARLLVSQAQDIKPRFAIVRRCPSCTQASTLGLIFAVNGSDASAVNDRRITAETSRGSELIASRDVNILAATTNRARSTASGLTAGAVSVGGSFADSRNDSSSAPDIGNQAHIQAGNNLTMRPR